MLIACEEIAQTVRDVSYGHGPGLAPRLKGQNYRHVQSDVRRRFSGPAAGLRQCGKPPHRAGGRAPTGDRYAAFDRREPQANHPSVADRKPGSGDRGGIVGSGYRVHPAAVCVGARDGPAAEPPVFEPDMYVMAFSVALSAVASVLFGLAPALHATRVSVAGAMKEQPFGSRLRLRSVLLGAQVAVSVILLVAAGLMMRGVQHASERNPGF